MTATAAEFDNLGSSLNGEAITSLDGEAPNPFTLLGSTETIPTLHATIWRGGAFSLLTLYFHLSPRYLIRVFFPLCFLFRSDFHSATTCAFWTRIIIASMEDLAALLANNVSLTSKENYEVDVGGEGLETDGTGVTYDLVGRVVTDKPYSGHTLQSNIERLLRSVKGFLFQSLGENRFVLQFYHPLDRTHALEGCPWLVDRNALLLSIIPEGANPETMDLNLMNIVVRLSNIPMGFRKTEVAKRLCSNLGTVMEVLPAKGGYAPAFTRVRVQIDISEPLQRGVHLKLGDGTRKWIPFSYKRLPVYCFLCGILGHFERKCTLRFQAYFVDPGKSFPYGEWLKVPAPGSAARASPSGTTRPTMAGGLAESVRGADIFDVGPQRRVGGKENTPSTIHSQEVRLLGLSEEVGKGKESVG